MRALLVLALLALLTGCGAAINDRNAEWCYEHPIVGEALRQAAFEWHLASDGEVNFTTRAAHDCSDAWPRAVFEKVPAGYLGTMNAHGEMALNPEFAESPKHFRGLTLTLMHEMGHYLTGRDHSDDRRDIMHENSGQDESNALTARDVARLDRPSREITNDYPTGY